MSRSSVKESRRASPPGGVTYVTQLILDRIKKGEYSPHAKPLAKRLYTDGRMDGVWDELLRRDARDKFTHPARQQGLNPFTALIDDLARRSQLLKKLGDEESILELKHINQKTSLYRNRSQDVRKRIRSLAYPKRQELACMWLYYVVFMNALAAKGILTSSDLNSSEALMKWAGIEVPDHDSEFDRFELAADVLSGVDGKSPTSVFTRSDLALAANYLESTADELSRVSRRASLLLHNADADAQTHVDVGHVVTALRQRSRFILSLASSRLHVKRHRGDGALRAFAIETDETMRSLFGTSMYGTTATITNVALDRDDVTGARIRELVRRS